MVATRQAPPNAPRQPPNFNALTADFIVGTVEATTWTNNLIYGPYGGGKTRFAGTACLVPGMGDVLYLDAERGERTIREFGDKVQRLKVENFKSLNKIYEYLRIHCRLRDAGDMENLALLEQAARHLDAPPTGDAIPQYRTVIIDTLSELNVAARNLITGNEAQRDLAASPISTELRQWGESADMIRKIVRHFRDLPMHTIFLASEKDKEVTVGNREIVKKVPNFSGQLANDVQGFFDIVGYLQAIPGPPDANNQPTMKRRLWIVPQTTFDAKHRLGPDAPAYFDNPVMGDLAAVAFDN